MENRSATANTENPRNLPGGLALGRPSETLELAGRQQYATYVSFGDELATGMRMEVQRHQLKHPPVVLHAALKCRMPRARREGEGSDGTAAIVNRDCEPVTDAERRRFGKQFALRYRHLLEMNARPPLEGLWISE